MLAKQNQPFIFAKVRGNYALTESNELLLDELFAEKRDQTFLLRGAFEDFVRVLDRVGIGRGFGDEAFCKRVIGFRQQRGDTLPLALRVSLQAAFDDFAESSVLNPVELQAIGHPTDFVLAQQQQFQQPEFLR